MPDFEATLVREKITLTETPAGSFAGDMAVATVVRSNRVVLKLDGPVTSETVVVRAQTMPLTLRMAGKILFSYFKSGLFLRRAEPFDWQGAWDSLLSSHDVRFSPRLWCAVYINGKRVYASADMPFVDIIEETAQGGDDYDSAVSKTRRVLHERGQVTDIDHANKVAAVFTEAKGQLRVGVIQRAAGKDKTFNFIVSGGEVYSRVVQGFMAAAAFIEAIDIRYYMRDMQKSLARGTVVKGDPALARFYSAPERLTELRKSVQAFEAHFDVNYRPEKPEVFSPPKEG